MSLFGFGDIKFNKQNSRNFGPLSALEGTQFEKNTFRYPIDVGSTDKGHYLVIYISQQKNTEFKGTPIEENLQLVSQRRFGSLSNIRRKCWKCI
jgi:hypothetical protein